jgi:2-dehydropantoate 2-reductase
MNILIAGTGGVGGFFGAKLAEAGNTVWFLARGKHLDAMRTDGLHVESTQGIFHLPPERMIAHPSEAGPIDAVLFCVKSYDTESAAAQLRESSSSASLILSLQNGIDNEEKLRAILPEAEIAGGVAYISSRIDAPGKIVETGGFQRIVYGSFWPHQPQPGSAGARRNRERRNPRRIAEQVRHLESGALGREGPAHGQPDLSRPHAARRHLIRT